VPPYPGDRRRGPAAYPVGHKISGCETRLTAIALDEATIASTHALSNHRSAEPIDQEQRGAAGENVTAPERGFQAVTWNRNASDLFACKWLRARTRTETDRQPRIHKSPYMSAGGFKRRPRASGLYPAPGSGGNGPPGGKSRWGHQVNFVSVLGSRFEEHVNVPRTWTGAHPHSAKSSPAFCS